MQVRAALQQLALQRNTQVLRTLSAPTETNHGERMSLSMGGGPQSAHPHLNPHLDPHLDPGQGQGQGNVHIITSGRFCRLIPKAHTAQYLRYFTTSD